MPEANSNPTTTAQPVALKDLKFEEKEPYEKGFSEYFETTVKSELESTEKVRLQKLDDREKVKKGFTKPLYITLAVGFVLIVLVPDLSRFIIMVMIIFALIRWAAINAPAGEYQMEVQKKVFPVIVKFFNFSYDQGKNIGTQTVKDSNLLKNFESYQYADYFSGIYNGVDIQIEGAIFTIRSGKSVVVVFQGEMILAKLNKKFTGKTVVKCDAGKIGNLMMEKPAGMEHVKLEDPKFESIFEVLSTDQIEARYLLTTAFMERLVKLSEFYKAPLQCSFFDNVLLIAVQRPSPRIFQPASIEKSIINTDDIHEFLAKMNTVFEAVDVLKLSTNN